MHLQQARILHSLAGGRHRNVEPMFKGRPSAQSGIVGEFVVLDNFESGSVVRLCRWLQCPIQDNVALCIEFPALEMHTGFVPVHCCSQLRRKVRRGKVEVLLRVDYCQTCNLPGALPKSLLYVYDDWNASIGAYVSRGRSWLTGDLVDESSRKCYETILHFRRNCPPRLRGQPRA